MTGPVAGPSKRIVIVLAVVGANDSTKVRVLAPSVVSF
jgi:hypothetical protein